MPTPNIITLGAYRRLAERCRRTLILRMGYAAQDFFRASPGALIMTSVHVEQPSSGFIAPPPGTWLYQHVPAQDLCPECGYCYEDVHPNPPECVVTLFRRERAMLRGLTRGAMVREPAEAHMLSA